MSDLRVIALALESVGSPENLAERLGVTVAQIEVYMAGTPLPFDLFLKAINVIAPPGRES